MSFIKRNTELTNEDVLIGECEGLSAIFEVSTSSAMPGLLMVETEHGPLYLDPDGSSKVVGPNGILEPEIVGPNGFLIIESEDEA